MSLARFIVDLLPLSRFFRPGAVAERRKCLIHLNGEH